MCYLIINILIWLKYINFFTFDFGVKYNPDFTHWCQEQHFDYIKSNINSKIITQYIQLLHTGSACKTAQMSFREVRQMQALVMKRRRTRLWGRRGWRLCVSTDPAELQLKLLFQGFGAGVQLSLLLCKQMRQSL